GAARLSPYPLFSKPGLRLRDSHPSPLNPTFQIVYNLFRSVSPPERMGKRMEPFQEKLTEREQEILARLAHGLSDQQIADELFLSLNTVKWYNRQIYGKLGVSRRTQAIARARELRLYGGETADAPDHIRDHLPAELNSFIGRKREVAEIQSL